MNRLQRCSLIPLLGLALSLGLLAGCATNKIDWAARVGTYTLDQAVLDFGPPDKQAKLTDGATVSEWLTRRGSNYLYGSPARFPYYGYSGFSTYVETSAPDSFLRLTFDPEGKLKAWKKLAR